MRKFPTGVTLLTAVKGDGSVGAMTANSVTSITLDPPLVLVCVAHSRNTLKYIRDSGRFAVNVLREGEGHVARYFAVDEEDRVGELPVEYSFNGRGTPRVKTCLSFMDCQVVAAHDHGDHTILVGEVHATQAEEGDPLVFFEGRYLGVDGGQP